MKKKILIIAAAAALLMTGCSADPNAPTGMKTASGEGADYTLFVPEDWTVDITTGATGAYYSNADTSGVLVTTWDLPHTDTTLDEWWETNLQEIQSVYQDVQVEGSENILIDGNHGVKYTWTGTLGAYTYRVLQAATAKNGSVYLFTYTSLPELYESHMEDVDQMLEFWLIP